MELQLLRIARGDAESLPSPEELSALLAKAEIGILTAAPEPSPELEETAWYLHAVASIADAQERFGVERQRAAYQVSAHVFDLLLQSLGRDLDPVSRMRYCFAAQIAYLRSDLDPNSTAVYVRELRTLWPDELEFTRNAYALSLLLGSALLGLETAKLMAVLPDLRESVRDLPNTWGVDTLSQTMFGGAAGVVEGVWALLLFLLYGDEAQLGSARGHLRSSLKCVAASGDVDARWVAAHLLRISEDLEKSSIWHALPPDVPDGVRRAFTLGIPRVLNLWPPQLQMLGRREEGAAGELFSLRGTRALLSMPTSSGKTLTAQMVIANHLVRQRTGVCFVTPTRSLCGEVRRALRKRLRYLTYGTDAAIAGQPGDMPALEVMTPESLASGVRDDLDALLDRFGLFIIDEAHHIGDANRGWTLEAALSQLHLATVDTDHCIILISAAIGNRNHFLQWLSTGAAPPIDEHSDWRGPRRLSCVYTSEPDWNDRAEMPMPRINSPRRMRYPLFGYLHAHVSHTNKITRMRFTESVGDLLLRPDEGDARDAQSTPFYQTLVPMIEHLMLSGPVLVVESTTKKAKDLAVALAEAADVGVQSSLVEAIEAAVEWLGDKHPITQLLRQGVAYHIGPLPRDVRAAIEKSFAAGAIRCLVATTTLAEGVNLPVRSVVIGSTGTYTRDGYRDIITGPKLLNVIGRAGRAAMETEGVVVFGCHDSRNVRPSFTVMGQDPDAVMIRSTLAVEDALQQLVDLERLLAVSQDAVFVRDKRYGQDFMSYVWSIAAGLDQLHKVMTAPAAISAAQSTFAWQQLDDGQRKTLIAVANAVFRAYQSTPVQRRRRWATSGTTLATSRDIEDYVLNLLQDPDEIEKMQAPVDLIRFLLSDGRLLAIAASEVPRGPVFHNQRGGGRRELDVDVCGLICDWVRGRGLTELADDYLDGIVDIEYRFEQLGDFMSSYVEYQIPRVLETVVVWFNQMADENGVGVALSEDLPRFARFGTHDETVVRLMTSGITSRSLAERTAAEWSSNHQTVGVGDWLSSLRLTEWRELLDLTPRQTRQLMEVVRPEHGGLAAEVVQGREAVVAVRPVGDEPSACAVSLKAIDEADPAELGLWRGGNLVATMTSAVQVELDDLVETGLPLSLLLTNDGTEARLAVRLRDMSEL